MVYFDTPEESLVNHGELITLIEVTDFTAWKPPFEQLNMQHP